jgi:hypothetical protein
MNIYIYIYKFVTKREGRPLGSNCVRLSTIQKNIIHTAALNVEMNDLYIRLLGVRRPRTPW